jgi:hypothetical protein
LERLRLDQHQFSFGFAGGIKASTEREMCNY